MLDPFETMVEVWQTHVKTQIEDVLLAVCHQYVSFRDTIQIGGSLQFDIDKTQIVNIIISKTVLPISAKKEFDEDTEPLVDENFSSKEVSPKRKRGRPKRSVSPTKTSNRRKGKTDVKKNTHSTKGTPTKDVQINPQQENVGSQNKLEIDVNYDENTEDNAYLNDEDENEQVATDVKTEPNEVTILKCNKCEFVASCNDHLREHRAEYHREKLCEHCPFVASRMRQLLSHQEAAHADLSATCPECLLVVDNRKELKEHMATVHCTGWRCLTCATPHPTFAQLTEHVKTHHEDISAEGLSGCERCQMVFESKDALNKHKSIAHVYSCNRCEESFDTAGRLTTHRMQNHPEHAFECGICGKNVINKSALVAHIKRHKVRAAGDLQCHVCQKQFTDKSHLHHHIRGLHQQNKYKCTQCDKSFSFSYSLRLHRIVHSGQRPHACHLCSKAYLTAAHLRAHINAVHAESRPFKCRLCGKGFSYQQSLLQHQRIHRKEQPYICQACGKMFVSKSHLRTHEDTHNDTKYECSRCDKICRTKALLRVHEKRHTDAGQRFMCDICGRQFMWKSTLQIHKLVHSDKRNFECEVCGLTFKTQSTLYTHRLVHKEENPYHCHHCGKNFKTKERMKAHEKRHLGIKPFECAVCTASFPEKGGLTKHMKTVHADKHRFKCPVCGKTATRADNLRVHMKVHNDPALLKMTQEELLDKEGGAVVIQPDSLSRSYRKRGRSTLSIAQRVPVNKEATLGSDVPVVNVANNGTRSCTKYGNITQQYLDKPDDIVAVQHHYQKVDTLSYQAMGQVLIATETFPNSGIQIFPPCTFGDRTTSIGNNIRVVNASVDSTQSTINVANLQEFPINTSGTGEHNSSQTVAIQQVPTNVLGVTVSNTDLIGTGNIYSSVESGTASTFTATEEQLRVILNAPRGNPLFALAEVMAQQHYQQQHLLKQVTGEQTSLVTVSENGSKATPVVVQSDVTSGVDSTALTALSHATFVPYTGTIVTNTETVPTTLQFTFHPSS